MRERTGFPIILYGLYLVYLGLSFRDVSKALKPFVERSHISVLEMSSEASRVQKAFKR
ncbi:MAG: hypothetical protein QW470_07650 [Candidatus Caldarchaeum sp.]